MSSFPGGAGSFPSVVASTPAASAGAFDISTKWDDGVGVIDSRLVIARAPVVTIDSNSPGNLNATLDITFPI